MRRLTPWIKIKAEYLQGVTPKELGVKYGLTAKQISDKANSEKWVKEKSEIAENVRKITEERIASLSNLALDTLENVIKDEETDKGVKVSACKSILDISGLKSSKIEQTNINKNPIPIEIIE